MSQAKWEIWFESCRITPEIVFFPERMPGSLPLPFFIQHTTYCASIPSASFIDPEKRAVSMSHSSHLKRSVR